MDVKHLITFRYINGFFFFTNCRLDGYSADKLIITFSHLKKTEKAERSQGRRDERVSIQAELTQDGEDAEQDGRQGVSAQSHLASAGVALGVDPPGVAAARLGWGGFAQETHLDADTGLWRWQRHSAAAAEVLRYLDGQGGDAGERRPTSVADVHPHAVVLGVVQAEGASGQDEGRRAICIDEEEENEED